MLQCEWSFIYVEPKNVIMRLYHFMEMLNGANIDFREWLFPNLFIIPGPWGSRGHAVIPPLRPGGGPHLSLRLPGRVQRSHSPGAETGALLWHVSTRCPHLHVQHHDVGDGIGWDHGWTGVPGFFQCWEATCGRCRHNTSNGSFRVTLCKNYYICQWGNITLPC